MTTPVALDKHRGGATEEALERLGSSYGALRGEHGPFTSLAPDRDEATPLHTLARELLAPEDAPELAVAFAEGLDAILVAQVEHFPETIYWDMDFMAASLLAQGRAGGAQHLRALCQDVASIQAQYGRHSAICFRYVHDFTYGYDWAKWIGRDPSTRARFGPFDAHFISYLQRRGEELVALIMADDEKYPKLPSGKPRNPFGFAREPEHEARLFAQLAEHDELPLKTWSPTNDLVWDGDYACRREERASALGILTRTSARDA